MKYKPLDRNTAGPTDKWWLYVMYNGYDENGFDTGTELEHVGDKITASRTISPFKTQAETLNRAVILAEYDENKLVNMAIETKDIYSPGVYSYN